MTDLSKVSKKLQNYVADVAKMEGNKKQIDTQTEFNKLGEYLSGHKNEMNVHERAFIEGFMVEFTNKESEQEITKDAKNLVKEIAKRTGNKKEIDSDEEAQALALALKNTKGDLNEADLNYIRNVLISSGFGSYVPNATTKKEELNSAVVNNDASTIREETKQESVNDKTPEVNEKETKNCDCDENKKAEVSSKKTKKPAAKHSPVKKKASSHKNVPNSKISSYKKDKLLKRYTPLPDINPPKEPDPKNNIKDIKDIKDITSFIVNNINNVKKNNDAGGNNKKKK